MTQGLQTFTYGLLIFAFTGCANLPWYARPRDRDTNTEAQTVTIYYATSRAKAGGQRVDSFFTAEKARALVHGTCRVKFPPGDNAPTFPSTDALKYREDVAAFYQSLNDELAVSDKPLLVFVHGFAVPFHSAIFSTAILSRNLNDRFVAFSYSWPSKGKQSKKAYNFDRERRDFAARELVKFLRELKTNLPNRKIDLVAHSMGCHVLLRACELWPTEETPPFQNIVLAAADVDAEDFKSTLAAHATKLSKRTTLYASDGDKALVFAIREVYHGETRAGYVWRGRQPPLCIAPGVETIDVSAVDKELIGHGYFLGNDRVRDDLFSLLSNGLAADHRNLRSAKQNGLKYYLMR